MFLRKILLFGPQHYMQGKKSESRQPGRPGAVLASSCFAALTQTSCLAFKDSYAKKAELTKSVSGTIHKREVRNFDDWAFWHRCLRELAVCSESRPRSTSLRVPRLPKQVALIQNKLLAKNAPPKCKIKAFWSSLRSMNTLFRSLDVHSNIVTFSGNSGC